MAAEGAFSRSAALLGGEAMVRLAASHVLVVGVGGVGSWCAEALVRTGLGAITLMDDDTVAESNLNRQAEAVRQTVGRVKVEAMRERLLAINPDCRVTAVNRRFETFSDLAGLKCDLIADCIDSVGPKAELILGATASGIPIFSSMGAALRTDPAKVTLKRFDRVAGDGLARALRERFRRLGRHPAARFDCVCSEEMPLPAPADGVRGSLVTVTAAFGLALAAAVIKQTITYQRKDGAT